MNPHEHLAALYKFLGLPADQVADFWTDGATVLVTVVEGEWR
ncbi:hypothetical protein LWF01_02060 [Saxibacter everestensis]|uniref:Sulfotransferase n=1 Tax=Saxibacter everestensis TaxID=2909229 RepID=A0ABY8QWN9_9MICO|nr:hypothetical protein LWF01_02060 [Brevibacteriaceae bacterium ZFBP1038]